MTNFTIYFGQWGKIPTSSISVFAENAYSAYESIWGELKNQVLYITSQYHGEDDGGTFVSKYELDNPQTETYEYPF